MNKLPSERIKEIRHQNDGLADTEGELAINWIKAILTYLDETASQEKECNDGCDDYYFANGKCAIHNPSPDKPKEYVCICSHCEKPKEEIKQTHE